MRSYQDEAGLPTPIQISSAAQMTVNVVSMACPCRHIDNQAKSRSGKLVSSVVEIAPICAIC
jgi:hypothetical protein